ncbi:MAG: hypothetical protein EOP38_22335 [Rubrivivax sp.]|nr:MAG: hypothetical protein EOP38_22335 [Rubrivivax sp.]
MNKRLQALLALLLVLLVVRWWDPFPSSGDSSSTLSAAIERPALAHDGPRNETAKRTPLVYPPALEATGVRQPEPGNAFEVRGATSPADSTPATSPAHRVRRVVVASTTQLQAEAPPQPEPAQPPPPFQVIGTWNDGQNPGVFIASSSGTLLAKPGQTLLADYQVERISQQELVLKQLSNQREWALPIPQPTNRLPTAFAK